MADTGKKWAQAFNDAAQTYAAQEYGVTVQPNSINNGINNEQRARNSYSLRRNRDWTFRYERKYGMEVDESCASEQAVIVVYNEKRYKVVVHCKE